MCDIYIYIYIYTPENLCFSSGVGDCCRKQCRACKTSLLHLKIYALLVSFGIATISNVFYMGAWCFMTSLGYSESMLLQCCGGLPSESVSFMAVPYDITAVLENSRGKECPPSSFYFGFFLVEGCPADLQHQA